MGESQTEYMAQYLKKDSVTKAYMSDCEIFADVFNQFIYGGKSVILPEQLRELDTTSVTVPYRDGLTDTSVQRFRDIFKLCTVKEREGVVYFLLGIENQSEIHFAMPVRNMLYDALAYTQQVEQTAKKHQLERKQKNEQKKQSISALQAGQELRITSRQVSAAEYLSGFYKGDCLIPVVTLVVYFGADEWDAPKSLHEMLDIPDEKILPFVAEYCLNLIVPAQMGEEEIRRFTTSFREVMLFIKYSKDKQRLRDLVLEDSAFRRVDREAARVISTVTGTNLQLNESEEAVDMCLAIEEMCKEERMEGRIEGRMESRTETAQRMLQAEKYPLEDIAYISGMTIDKVWELQNLLENNKECNG